MSPREPEVSSRHRRTRGYARPVRHALPPAVVTAAVGRADAELVALTSEPVAHGSGAATSSVVRITGSARAGSELSTFSMVRKEFRPVTHGRHAAAAGDERHWAYWRREPLAYAAGLLPDGPELSAPRCYGVVGDTVYLADITGGEESPSVAARRLGAWQATTAVPDVPWLATDQLGQRVRVTSLDWTAMDVPDSLPRIWDRRDELLGMLAAVPVVVCHGDFHVGNLLAGDDVTTVLDWGTFGAGPVGADLAHLALSTLDDHLDAYLAGLGGRYDPELVRLGYEVTLTLTGASRVHWMLSRGVPIPPGYVDLITGAEDRWR
jgi:hypothetical protein